MMKQNLSDKGLKKAMLSQQTPHRLSSNFTFRTMLKVEEQVRMQEAKQEKQMLLGIVAASLFLLISGVITIAYYWGDTLYDTFAALLASTPSIDWFSPPYWMSSFIFLILMGFDFWMRRHYHKHHQP